MSPVPVDFLKNFLMYELGIDRKDIQGLLSWWFGGQQKAYIFLSPPILTRNSIL